MKRWTLDDIPWDQFDPSRVDADILALVKAASLVEGNGRDYGVYLCNVFGDDPDFQQIAVAWSKEEVQHGVALGKWARLADPDFNFDAAFRRFTDGYRLPLEATTSVRGSRTGELVARCIVETGTSTYYTALGESTDEPVLKAICHHIAADELRHYKMFYTHMKRYHEREPIGLIARARVALGRLLESDDDELAYAYFAANENGVYDRRRIVRAYARQAYGYYRPHHIERAIAMILKAVGAAPNGWLNRILARIAYGFMQYRIRHFAAAEGAVH